MATSRNHPRTRAPKLGVSNDRIWMSSSFTMPPVPDETLRTGDRSGAATYPPPLPRAVPTASISSMKPIAPPSRRAAFFSARKKERSFQAVIPYHMLRKAGADTKKKGTPASAAIAFARCVFPVPGRPSKRMPRRGLAPSSSRNVR